MSRIPSRLLLVAVILIIALGLVAVLGEDKPSPKQHSFCEERGFVKAQHLSCGYHKCFYCIRQNGEAVLFQEPEQ